ncbi:MAG: hypothetical protein E6K17_05230 [Methanobacteriota archaeon]|nr:MAG: hypothetical protein E6K17_05230 [Euryarchaeota archaeon]
MSEKTRERLARLKSSPRETYDELLGKLLTLIPEGDEEGRYTESFRVGLLNARLDIKEGRLTDHREAKKRLGL